MHLLLVIVVVDRDLFRVDSRRRRGGLLPRGHVLPLVGHLGRRLPLGLFIDGVSRALDLCERLGLGGGERAGLLGFEGLEVALGDGVDAVLDAEEGREGERLRVGVPRGCGRKACERAAAT